MSRTYRRKNAHEEYSCTYEDDLVSLEGGGYDWHRRFLKGKELKQALADYHSDTSQWNWNVPKDFIRAKNVEVRRKNKAIFDRSIRDDNDEPVFIPYIHNAAYDYW